MDDPSIMTVVKTINTGNFVRTDEVFQKRHIVVCWVFSSSCVTQTPLCDKDMTPSLLVHTFMVSGTEDMERIKDPRAWRTTLVKEATSMMRQQVVYLTSLGFGKNGDPPQ